MSNPGNDEPFTRLLATKYRPELEDEALAILEANPHIARSAWAGPDEGGKPFVKGSTALHYAANDGKLRLVARLLELGADPNASDANWFRSVLSWAANNARLKSLRLLLDNGASPQSLDALHAAAWGGSSAGNDTNRDYVGALRMLVEAGADVNDRRHYLGRTPLDLAIESGHKAAIQFLRSLGAEEPASE